MNKVERFFYYYYCTFCNTDCPKASLQTTITVAFSKGARDDDDTKELRRRNPELNRESL